MTFEQVKNAIQEVSQRYEKIEQEVDRWDWDTHWKHLKTVELKPLLALKEKLEPKNLNKNGKTNTKGR